MEVLTLPNNLIRFNFFIELVIESNELLKDVAEIKYEIEKFNRCLTYEVVTID